MEKGFRLPGFFTGTRVVKTETPTIDCPAIAITDSVTDVRDYAFINNRLTSVTIPDGATIIYIPERLFRNNQLTSVTIPDSVVSIGIWAFQPRERESDSH